MSNERNDPKAQLKKLRDLEFRVKKTNDQVERAIGKREMDLRKATERMGVEIQKQQNWINQTQRAISRTQAKLTACQQKMAHQTAQLAAAENEAASAQKAVETERKDGKGGGGGGGGGSAAQARLSAARQKAAGIRSAMNQTAHEMNELNGQMNQLNGYMNQLQNQMARTQENATALKETNAEYQAAARRVRANMSTNVPAALRWLRERQRALEEFDRTGGALRGPYHAARQNLESRSTQASIIEARRYVTEGAAQATMGPDAEILDDHAKGQRGGNFKGFDISSEEGFASVKAKYAGDGPLTDDAIKRYTDDYEKMVTMDLKALKEHAQNIIHLREMGVPLPGRLANATLDEILHFLRTETILLVPDDHVKPIINKLVETAIRNSSQLRLPPMTPDLYSTYFAKRIRGFGLTSMQVNEIINNFLSGDR